jgi:putative transposase
MLAMMLSSSNVIMNVKKIRRLKREYGLATRIRRRTPYKNLPTSEDANVPNLLSRNFVTPIPDQVYSTDMTYLFYGKHERAYLSATKDLATNEVVSYKLMRTPSLGNFVEEFRRMLNRLPEHKRRNLIIHSDQGFQYTHGDFRNLLKSYGVSQSMSRKGNCLDNAPIESFFGHFKDLLELKDCENFEAVITEVKNAMNYYNHERPQLALNKKPPVVYRGLLSGLY